jgi:hypothetical protein
MHHDDKLLEKKDDGDGYGKNNKSNTTNHTTKVHHP